MNIEKFTPPTEHQPLENNQNSHQSKPEMLNMAVPQSNIDSVKKQNEREIAKIRTSLGLEQSLTEIDDKQTVIPMEDLRKKAQDEGGVILYHGGLPDDTTLEKIDLDRLGSQQNKKGRTYGGFYLTDDSSKHWTEKYASERNGNIHGFLIPNTSRVVEIQDKNTDRLSQEQRTELANNYDLVKGKDLLGRVQYVLLNKSVVNGLGIEKITPTK